MTNRCTRVVSQCVALLGLGVVSLVPAGCAHRAPIAAAPGAPIAALMPSAPPEAGPEYRIQPGDELHVRFLYQPDMSEQLPVRPDGRLSLGSTGELAVAGLTPTELERLIEQKSASHLRNPEVSVVMTKIAEQRVYVGGEVAKPGYVVLRPGMTPLQAVVQSGGFRKTAKLDSVLLITPSADGKFSAARLDMEQVVDAGVPERVRLHAEDIVYVPPTWVSDMTDVVDQYVRGLIPGFPRVGIGYSVQ